MEKEKRKYGLKYKKKQIKKMKTNENEMKKHKIRY